MAEVKPDEATARLGALDGVRGVALVAVMAFHAFPDVVPGGFVGVEAFFVLSGFLLARLLLAEHDRTGTIDIGDFARRRLRRIVPALWTLLAVLVVLAPLVDDAYRLVGDVAWSAAGLTNWHLVADQTSYFTQLGRPSLVRHLWSVAVEAQFYVVCPFVVLWAARRRRWQAAAVLAAGVAASATLLGLAAQGTDPSRAYYGTDTRVGALLSGVLAALLLRAAPVGRTGARTSVGSGVGSRPVPAPRRPWYATYADGLAAGGGLVLLGSCWVFGEGRSLLYPFGFLVVQAATAALIIGAVHGTAGTRVLRVLPLRWLGRRSYGIYLWHWPLVALLRPGLDVGWNPAVAALVGIAGALLLGHASFVLVERPFLGPARSRPTLEPAARAAAVACAAFLIGGLVGIAVQLPKNDPIAEAIQAGEQLLAAQAVAPARAVVPPTLEPPPAAPPSSVGGRPTLAPGPTAQAATVPSVSTVPPVPSTLGSSPAAPAGTVVAAPTVPAPGSVAVTAVGDSVMLSAAAPLSTQLGGNSVIDAKVSRQFTTGVEIVTQLAQQGRLAPVVVVHLGTNGPPTPADVDAMVAAAGSARLLLVTVRLNRSWMAETNAVLGAAPARHPEVTLVDWSTHSEGHPEWFYADRTHLTTAGAGAYTALIAAALAPPSA